MPAAPTNLSEYYQGQGKALPSVTERAPIYQQYGGQGTYSGTAEQNTFLLSKLVGGTPSTTVPTPGSGTYVQDLANQYQSKITDYTGNPIVGGNGPVINTSQNQSSPSSSWTAGDGSKYDTTGADYLETNGAPVFKSKTNPNAKFISAALRDQYDAQQGNSSTTNSATSTSESERAKARADEIAKIKAELEPDTTKPTLYKSADEYKRLRDEQGVVNDEGELASIRNEANLAKEDLRKFSATAGEGTTEAGRTGMMSEAERNIQFKIEGLALQESAVVDRLNSKNSYISTMLSLGQQDYQSAVTEYNNEYNKNLQAVQLYNENVSQDKQDAMTGFTTITNLLKDKNVNYASLDPALKSQIQTLELKAGLPAGTFETLSSAYPDDKILSPITVDNAAGGKDIYFFSQDAKTGQPKLLKTYSAGSGSGNGLNTTGNSANSPEVSSALNTILGSGKFTAQQRKDVINAINNGNDPLVVIKNQAKNIMGQTEATKLSSYEVARDTLSDIGDELSQFYANGGNTNLISGNFEKVYNNLGNVKDPKLVDLATQIQGNIQIYRNAISGTAYSEQEGRDITSIFPGINKSQTLNNAILGARTKLFDSIIDANYRSVLGSDYDTIKGASTAKLDKIAQDAGATNTVNQSSNNKTATDMDSATAPQPWYNQVGSWLFNQGKAFLGMQ